MGIKANASRHQHRGADLQTVSPTGSRLDLTPLETPATLSVIDGDTIRARGDMSTGKLTDPMLTDPMLMTEPDAYYYDIGAKPQLPALRLRFDDPAQTWLYLDPTTGEILNGVDSRRRAYRWFCDLFHKWDLNSLTLRRPLRDILLCAFSIVGLITSVSGAWIGWKRIRR